MFLHGLPLRCNICLLHESNGSKLCDKIYISPVLAIELDDKTHELPERQERDTEVERILKNAGVPLLRIQNGDQFDTNVISERVTRAITETRSVVSQ